MIIDAASAALFLPRLIDQFSITIMARRDTHMTTVNSVASKTQKTAPLFKKKSIALLALAISFAVEPSVASANQALEEVIVTARKREENLQALPQAINALQSDQLEAAQVSNIQNLQNVIPNVTIGNGASIGAANTLNAVVRGIGNEAGFAPGVGIYIDDIYLATANGAVLDV
jgi:iron complex outermembrane recepter protein